MVFLLLTILLNVFVSVAFKLFARYRVDNLQAIVVNYGVCILTGCLFTGSFPVGMASLQLPWFGWSVVMGVGLITIFSLIAYCTKANGITTTTVANKLSMVIPASAALWLYGDRLTAGKGIGILLALPAVYLSAGAGKSAAKQYLFWPVLLFLGSGLLDTLVSYVTRRYFNTGQPADHSGQAIYLIHAFSVAALIGFTIVIYRLIKGQDRFEWKNALAGCLLGVPNYFSVYFFFRLLQSGFLQSSAAIPVNNIGIVLAAALVALLFFKEKAGPLRIIGLLLSITAILLIACSDAGTT